MVARAYNEMETYVRQSAIRHGIDPDVAVAVAKAEALNVFDPDKPDHGGDDGSSFGLYQLHYGGMSKAMPNAGLGDEFTAKTGLDARDPSTWKQQVEFSHDWAAKNGWGSWMGAKNNGIGNWDGITSAPATATSSPSGVTPTYNPSPGPGPGPGPGPVLDANVFQRPQSSDDPIELIPSRQRALADDFAAAVDVPTLRGQRAQRDSGIIASPYDTDDAPLPEFEFASANAEVEGQAPPATATAVPPLTDDASLADLFKVGDIGMAGQVDPVTGLPVLARGRRAYG